MFDFFVVGEPSTVPRRGASREPLATPGSPALKKKTKPEADDADTSGSSSDSWSSSEDGDDDDVGPAAASAPTLGGGDGLRAVSEALPAQSNDGSSSCKRRPPRPPATKGKERRLSAREFVGMLRSLGVRGGGGGGLVAGVLVVFGWRYVTTP